MDLLPRVLYSLIRPLRRRQKLLHWHLANCERNTGLLSVMYHHRRACKFITCYVTGLFSTALPLIIVTSFFVGVGVLIIDKQREMAFYRLQSIGLREHQLNEEREQLVEFLNQTTVPSDQLELKLIKNNE